MTPPPKPPSRLDFDNPEQVARLLLAAVFASIALTRGEANDDIAKLSVDRADSLLDAVASAVKP